MATETSPENRELANSDVARDEGGQELLASSTPTTLFTPEERSEIAKVLHAGLRDGDTYRAALPPDPSCIGTAREYLDSYLEEVGPQNPVERMLAIQMLWQHGRIAGLIRHAATETRPKSLGVLNTSIEAAMNTFRRQAAALRDLKLPRSSQVITGRQVNVANQQVVQNAGGETSSNELGSHHGRDSESTPPLPAQR